MQSHVWAGCLHETDGVFTGPEGLSASLGLRAGTSGRPGLCLLCTDCQQVYCTGKCQVTPGERRGTSKMTGSVSIK